MNAKRIAVVMGGCSPEYAISMESGRAVLDVLELSSYEGRGVVICRDGLWALLDERTPSDFSEQSISERRRSPEEAVSLLRKWGVDVFFLALHGPGGEDGSIQGFLDTLGLTYTASGVHTSALAMDKPLAKSFLASHGIRTPAARVVDRGSWRSNREGTVREIVDTIDLPCFAKSVRLGSSVGVQRADDGEALCAAVDAVFEVSPESVLVEQYIDGREFSCPVLGNAHSPLRVLPLVEIKPLTASFFDYGAKYEPGGAEEICNPDLDPEIARSIRAIAARVHELIGARGFSRSDFILDSEGIWFLEVNTIPGLTAQSILPRSAESDGISFEDLVGTIIELSLNGHEPEGKE